MGKAETYLENASSEEQHEKEDAFFEANPHLAKQRKIVANRDKIYEITILECFEKLFEVYQILRLYFNESKIDRYLMVKLLEENGLNISEGCINLNHIHNGFLKAKVNKIKPQEESNGN